MIINKFLNRIFPDYSFRKTSYSQCGEDLMIRVLFTNVLKILRPSFIDIGAFHPFKFSNTYLLYKFGSRGINIEPNPDSFYQFEKHRPLDTNLNIGIGVKTEVLKYYKMSSSALNTFSEPEAKRMAKEEGEKIVNVVEVKVKTIQDVLTESGFSEFPDFLSIDVEGYDLDLLKTIDFQKASPKVICAETILYSQNGNSKKNEELISFVKNQDYCHYADTMINSIFVRNDLIKDTFQETPAN